MAFWPTVQIEWQERSICVNHGSPILTKAPFINEDQIKIVNRWSWWIFQGALCSWRL